MRHLSSIIKVIFIYLVLISALSSSLMVAYPYAYRRLILKQNGSIIKIVDLISDVHFPENQFDADEIISYLQSLCDEGISINIRNINCAIGMGENERALIAELQKIGVRCDGESIELIAESDVDFHKPEVSAATPLALLYIGQNFYREYNPHQKRRLVYSDGDSYRRLMAKEDELSTESADREEEPDVLNELTEMSKFLNSPFDKKSIQELRVLFNDDLEKLKEKAHPKIYKKVKKLCNRFVSIELPCAQRIIDGEFLRIMDYELLIKIFSSEARHVIIYAGGLHCKHVSEILVNKFNFVISRSMGTENDAKIDSWGLKWKMLKAVFKEAWHHAKHTKTAEERNIFHARVFMAILQEMQKMLPPIPARTWKTIRSYPAGYAKSSAS